MAKEKNFLMQHLDFFISMGIVIVSLLLLGGCVSILGRGLASLGCILWLIPAMIVTIVEFIINIVKLVRIKGKSTFRWVILVLLLYPVGVSLFFIISTIFSLIT